MNLLPLDIISLIGCRAGPQTYGMLIRTCTNFSLLAKDPYRLHAIKILEHCYQFRTYTNHYKWIDVPIATSFEELLFELYTNYMKYINASATHCYLNLHLYRPIQSDKKILIRTHDSEYRPNLYYLNDIPEFNEKIVKFNRRNCDYEYIEPYQLSIFNGINIEHQNEFATEDNDIFDTAFEITRDQYEEITIMDINFSLFKSMLTVMYFHTDEYAGTFLDIKKFVLKLPYKY